MHVYICVMDVVCICVLTTEHCVCRLYVWTLVCVCDVEVVLGSISRFTLE